MIPIIQICVGISVMIEFSIDMQKKIVHGYVYERGSFASIGKERRDIIFHFPMEEDNIEKKEITKVLKIALDVDPNILLTTNINIKERKITSERIITEDYSTEVLFHPYFDDNKLTKYNKIQMTRISLDRNMKKEKFVNIQVGNNMVTRIYSPTRLDNIKFHCSERIWMKIIALYKLNNT